jgi:hypothetical protein
MKGAALVVGRALVPDDSALSMSNPLAQPFCEARFSYAGLAREQHYLTLTRCGLFPAVEQQCQLLLTAD